MAIQFNINGAIKQPSKIQICVDGVIKNATKVQVNIDGVIKTVWQAGTPLGDLPLMSIVKIEENGVAQDFFVVRHNAYTSGRTLLLRRYTHSDRQWHSSAVNAYATCTLDAWLNGDYLNSLPDDIQSQIADVSIPYTPGNGTTSLSSLSRKVFAVSATELGQTHQYLNAEGTALANAPQLTSATNSGGTAKIQWTRSPYTNNTTSAWRLSAAGDLVYNAGTGTGGVRPAFTLPSSFAVTQAGYQSITSLNVGDKIKLGSIYGEPIVWKIADKNHAGYPSGAVTLVSEKIIKIMAFDAKEPSNSNSERQNSGNNRYSYANIRQWLNSDAIAGAWYQSQHAADAPPDNGAVSANPYTALSGFLNAFTSDEKGALLSTTLTVAKNTVTDGGGSESVVDKVFIPSNTEVGLANENSIAEGSTLAVYAASENRIAQPTTAAVANSDYSAAGLSDSQPWSWLLRTPTSTTAGYTRRVGTTGTLSNNNANSGTGGLRPACNLSGAQNISLTPDADGCYTLIF